MVLCKDCICDSIDDTCFAISDGDLYSATVADFSATDSLIIKDNLRTEQYDFKQLNCKYYLSYASFLTKSLFCYFLFYIAPDFVNALEDENHIYFFFREAAVEHINCGKVWKFFSPPQMKSPKIFPKNEFFFRLSFLALQEFASLIKGDPTNSDQNGQLFWSPGLIVQFLEKLHFISMTYKLPPTLFR